jgi:hypothetical protein
VRKKKESAGRSTSGLSSTGSLSGDKVKIKTSKVPAMLVRKNLREGGRFEQSKSGSVELSLPLLNAP